MRIDFEMIRDEGHRFDGTIERDWPQVPRERDHVTLYEEGEEYEGYVRVVFWIDGDPPTAIVRLGRTRT